MPESKLLESRINTMHLVIAFIGLLVVMIGGFVGSYVTMKVTDTNLDTRVSYLETAMQTGKAERLAFQADVSAKLTTVLQELAVLNDRSNNSLR